jgi:hypothetical protein
VGPDEVRLFIVTAERGLSPSDVGRVTSHVVPSVIRDGTIEAWARDVHRATRFDAIYTPKEELVLRAAYLRELLDVPGLRSSGARLFRDKVAMKAAAEECGVSVPRWKRLHSPSCLLAFIEACGLPVLVKPVFSAGAAHVRVLRTPADVDAYLASGLCAHLVNEGFSLELAGDSMVEAFVDGPMIQVNAIVERGIVARSWAFEYLGNILAYTAGRSYGNVRVLPDDPRLAPAVETTERITRSFAPDVDRLVVHAEFFVKDDGRLMLCEIAARRPGGSMPLLIARLEGAPLERVALRWSAGLDPELGPVDKTRVVADLIVPLRIGRFLGAPDVCPVDGVTYRRLAVPGTVHGGFVPGVMLAAAHFIVDASSADDAKRKLGAAEAWFANAATYDQDGVMP